jgi:hypothetical protein
MAPSLSTAPQGFDAYCEMRDTNLSQICLLGLHCSGEYADIDASNHLPTANNAATRTIDGAPQAPSISKEAEGSLAIQTVINRSNFKESLQTKAQPELISTPFGNLTQAELRDWKKMLGRKLLRIPKEV